MTNVEKIIEKCCKRSEKIKKELISENEQLLSTLKSLPSQRKIPMPKMIQNNCGCFSLHAVMYWNK